MKSDLIFWLAIAAVYVLQAVASRKKKKAAELSQSPDGLPIPPMEESYAGGETNETSSPGVVTDIESALSEISRMLQGEDSHVQSPHKNEEKQRFNPGTAKEETLYSRQTSESNVDFHERTRPGRRTDPVSSPRTLPLKKAPYVPGSKAPRPEFRSAGTMGKRTFFDDAFENSGAGEFHAPVITHDHEYDFGGYDKSGKALGSSENPPVASPDLTHPKRLREAFIAAEIFGKPISKRHR